MSPYQGNTTIVFYDGYWFTTSRTSLVMYLVISFVTVVGNGIICFLYVWDPFRELRSLQNYFIVNLAISDLIMGAVVEPLLIATHWEKEQRNFLFFLHFQFAIIAGVSSLLNVTALSIFRYFAVKMPLNHHTVLTRKRILYSIGIIWVFSLHFALLPFFWRSPSFQIYLYSFGCLLPSAGIMIAYAGVFKNIRNHTARFKSGIDRFRSVSATVIRNTTRREKSINKTIFIIVVVFLALWTPFLIVDILMVQFYFRSQRFHVIRDITLTMMYFSSGINPLLYAWRIVQFRKAFAKICGCQWLLDGALDRHCQSRCEPREVFLTSGRLLYGLTTGLQPSTMTHSTSAATIPVGLSEINIQTL